MENKVNKFGYIAEGEIKDKLRFPESLRGCNKNALGDLSELYKLDFIPDDILNMLPTLDLETLPTGINSFTYQRLTLGNNDAIGKYVYACLLLADLGKQIEDCLLKHDACIVKFDNYVNEDYEALGSYTPLIRAFKDILVFRGFYVIEEENGLVVINCDNRITKEQTNRILESLEGKEIIIDVVNRFDVEKEELIYRGIGELLATTVRYSTLTGIWMNCKERIEDLYGIEFNDAYRVAYNAYYVYACLNSYEDLDDEMFKLPTEDNVRVLTEVIEVDKIDEMTQLGTDLEDSYYVNDLDPQLYQNEHAIGVEVLTESLQALEQYMDEYFSPDMLPIRCTRLFQRDLQLFSYELLKTKRGIPEPLPIPPIKYGDNSIEEIEMLEEDLEVEDIKGKKGKKKKKKNKKKEYDAEKGNSQLRKYLPIVAITMIVLILARLVSM